MSRHSSKTPLQNLDHILSILDSQPSGSHSPERRQFERRLRKVEEALTTYDKLKEEEQRQRKTQRWAYPVASVILLGSGIGAMASWVSPEGTWLAQQSPVFTVAGLAGLAGLGVYTFSVLQYNPLGKMRRKFRSLRRTLLRPFQEPRPQPAARQSVAPQQPTPQKTSRGFHKSKEDKVIAGVAGGLARMLGVNSALIRVLFLGFFFFSAGTFLVLYFIAAIVMSFFPDERR
jgi:phage shock protein PspC (stress-responsive transcriptional regulator)